MADRVQLPDLAEARRSRDEVVAAGHAAEIARAEMVLGAALFEAHQPAAALESFRAAAAAYRRAGAALEAGLCRLNEARTLSALGRAEECVAVYEAVAAEPGADLPGDPGGAGMTQRALFGLFEHHEAVGETQRADAVLARIREIHVAAGDSLELAEHDYFMGDRLRERGEYAAATRLLAEAGHRFAALGDARRAADCAMFEGAAHHAAGEWHQAADAFSRAEAGYAALGDAESAGAARANLAVVRGVGRS